ncbi:hypothetical protein E1B28_006779 [Marasmius oreades]|uniref:AB hydrolase-1 domain-containing protein n=1 Tax=Marasmius oreades TaxID=181124 RepID=A0A9P8AB53_9AGAR|nr:uncharacterized protein E1B28_006779 [Marasmius oreades]KAG7096103.1 hypothetical protein E1B28_006779 [Marasmius oreades]
MEDSSYRNVNVSRGYNYHYYVSSPKSGKPSVFFVHGFGIGSKDWRHQVQYFRQRGYGIIVPDMLGYAGSAIPNGIDPNELKYTSLVQDIVDILGFEQVKKAIFVSQGGGSPIASRIAQLHPDRVLACAFLSTPYLPPNPNFDYTKELQREKEKYGQELLGFMDFYANDAAVIKIVANHFDAFFNITYPQDPKSWSEKYGPSGELRKYLLSGEILPSPSWFPSDDDKNFQFGNLHNNGRNGPFTYYKAIVSGIQAEDDNAVPQNRYVIRKPVFFGAALDDYVSLPSEGKELTKKFCMNATVRDFKANHWMHLQIPDEVNQALLDWIQGL